MVSRMNPNPDASMNAQAPEPPGFPAPGVDGFQADFSLWPVLLARLPGRQPGQLGLERARQWLDTLEAALQRQQPFAVVCDMNAYISHKGESPEEKKAAALWMKRHLAAFHQYCRGNVYVIGDDAARAALLASGRQQAGASPVRIAAAATLPEAVALARQMLA